MFKLLTHAITDESLRKKGQVKGQETGQEKGQVEGQEKGQNKLEEEKGTDSATKCEFDDKKCNLYVKFVLSGRQFLPNIKDGFYTIPYFDKPTQKKLL